MSDWARRLSVSSVGGGKANRGDGGGLMSVGGVEFPLFLSLGVDIESRSPFDSFTNWRFTLGVHYYTLVSPFDVG
jgi:hypothetical protein